MTTFSRRSFLKRMAARGVAMGAGSMLPGVTSAAPWGCSGGGACSLSHLRVLEIFCYGGLSQWENFWVSRLFNLNQLVADREDMAIVRAHGPNPS